MIAEERECELDVSEFYLRLTTESIRLFSNKVRRLAKFRDVIDDRAALAILLPKYYTKSEINEHLSIIPTNGDITIKVTILETSAASLDEAGQMISDAIGLSVAFADTLSLLMYDFIVEENKTEVLTKLGLSSEQAASYRDILRKRPSNVVRFPK